jgi:hypothetical protein
MLPKLKFYVGSVDEAYDCICYLRLTKCDPVPEPQRAYQFPSSAALTAFVLAFGTDIWEADDMIIIPESRKVDADAALQALDLTNVVPCAEVFALEVWGREDEIVFDTLF